MSYFYRSDEHAAANFLLRPPAGRRRRLVPNTRRGFFQTRPREGPAVFFSAESMPRDGNRLIFRFEDDRGKSGTVRT